MNAVILLLPGDGIGPEVVAGAANVLRAVAAKFGHAFELPEAIIGAAALRAVICRRCRTRRSPLRGRPTRYCSALSAIRPSIAVPRRAGPKRRSSASARPLVSTRTCARRACGPASETAGPLKPEVLAGTDMLVVRELTGGLYYGEPRGIEADGSSAHNTMRYSRHEIERIARHAFESAAAPASTRDVGRQGQRARNVAPVADGRDRGQRRRIRT